MNFDIQLDTIKRYRNKSEYRTVCRASCNGMEEAGDHAVIRTLCRRLAEQNSQINGVVTVFRGDMLVFSQTPLKQWCKNDPWAGEQPANLRKEADNDF